MIQTGDRTTSQSLSLRKVDVSFNYKFFCKNRESKIYLADEFNILSLDILHNHDFHFIKEVQSQITYGIPEYKLVIVKSNTLT